MQWSHDTILHLENHMTKSSTKVSIWDFFYVNVSKMWDAPSTGTKIIHWDD